MADELTMTERIRASRERVFEYLVQPEKLMRWMGVAADIDPVPGGKFWLDVNGGDIAAGTYLEVDPPQRVVFTWGWEGSPHVPPGSSTVSFTLIADGDETVVELVHRGLPGGSGDEHHQGWTYFISRFVRAASGERLEPQDPRGEHGSTT